MVYISQNMHVKCSMQDVSKLDNHEVVNENVMVDIPEEKQHNPLDEDQISSLSTWITATLVPVHLTPTFKKITFIRKIVRVMVCWLKCCLFHLNFQQEEWYCD